ncbi:MAG: hypothetical protein ABH880_03035 [Patescibacteria group bacterium]
MQLSKERIQEFKDLLEKKEGKEISWEEAEKGAYNLMRFAELALELAEKDFRRQKKLEENPKGFHIEGIGYTCRVCHESISNEETWYDKNGIKCLLCQRALDKKVIPQRVCKDRDSWYAMWELNKEGIRTQTALKMMREGKLKARVVKGDNGKPHFYAFMKEENPTLKVGIAKNI